jgi:hypothetical protein
MWPRRLPLVPVGRGPREIDPHPGDRSAPKSPSFVERERDGMAPSHTDRAARQYAAELAEETHALSKGSRSSGVRSARRPCQFAPTYRLLDRYVEDVLALFTDNLRRYLAGEPLRNAVVDAGSEACPLDPWQVSPSADAPSRTLPRAPSQPPAS